MSRSTYRPWRHNGAPRGHIRSGFYWIDKTIHGHRHRIPTGCVTAEAANAEYERWEKNPAAYVPRSKTGSDWDEAVLKYIQHAENVEKLSPRYVEKVEAYLAAFGAWTRTESGPRVFASLEFSANDVRDFLVAMNAGTVTGKPSGAATFNRALAALKGFMGWARDVARSTANVADTEVSMVGENKGQEIPKGLEPRHWKPLVMALDARWRSAAHVQLGAGLRYGELARLQPEDILPHAIHIRVSKGGRGRTIPATKATVKSARHLLAVGGVPDDEGSQFNHRLKVAAKRAGVPAATTHAFRHTYGVVTMRALLRAGLGLTELQQRMGHASIKTTELYLRALRATGGARQVVGAPR